MMRYITAATLLLLLVVVPVLDLAWSEPRLDGSQGAGCQLHANPGVAFDSVSCSVSPPTASLSSSDAPTYLSLLGSSIFIPPRA